MSLRYPVGDGSAVVIKSEPGLVVVRDIEVPDEPFPNLDEGQRLLSMDQEEWAEIYDHAQTLVRAYHRTCPPTKHTPLSDRAENHQSLIGPLEAACPTLRRCKQSWGVQWVIKKAKHAVSLKISYENREGIFRKYREEEVIRKAKEKAEKKANKGTPLEVKGPPPKKTYAQKLRELREQVRHVEELYKRSQVGIESRAMMLRGNPTTALGGATAGKAMVPRDIPTAVRGGPTVGKAMVPRGVPTAVRDGATAGKALVCRSASTASLRQVSTIIQTDPVSQVTSVLIRRSTMAFSTSASGELTLRRIPQHLLGHPPNHRPSINALIRAQKRPGNIPRVISGPMLPSIRTMVPGPLQVARRVASGPLEEGVRACEAMFKENGTWLVEPGKHERWNRASFPKPGGGQ